MDKRNLKRVDIYMDPEFVEWLRMYSRSRGFHTVTAYVRHLLVLERERVETAEDNERRG